MAAPLYIAQKVRQIPLQVRVASVLLILPFTGPATYGRPNIVLVPPLLGTSHQGKANEDACQTIGVLRALRPPGIFDPRARLIFGSISC